MFKKHFSSPLKGPFHPELSEHTAARVAELLRQHMRNPKVVGSVLTLDACFVPLCKLSLTFSTAGFTSHV